MEKQGGQYGQYLLYLLAQMLRGGGMPEKGAGAEKTDVPDVSVGRSTATVREQAASGTEDSSPFTDDETDSLWRRETRTELLLHFCREAYPMAEKYGHFLLGEGPDGAHYLAVPGRFLVAEQPAGGSTGFQLWQPLRGGEAWYADLETMAEEDAERIYGYWIARLDPTDLTVRAV